MGKKKSPHMDVAPGKGGGIITPSLFSSYKPVL